MTSWQQKRAQKTGPKATETEEFLPQRPGCRLVELGHAGQVLEDPGDPRDVKISLEANGQNPNKSNKLNLDSKENQRVVDEMSIGTRARRGMSSVQCPVSGVQFWTIMGRGNGGAGAWPGMGKGLENPEGSGGAQPGEKRGSRKNFGIFQGIFGI